jgi:hypothetical protein
MKNLFSLFNFVLGILFLLIGLGIFLSISHQPQNMGAGIVTTCIGAVCLWLAKESTAPSRTLLS